MENILSLHLLPHSEEIPQKISLKKSEGILPSTEHFFVQMTIATAKSMEKE
jgi:hypothetical protein